jgi:glycosyltransferase involved in cell wall biosynthesis
MHKIVFLYSELAGYFLSCINELTKRNDVEVYIVRWPVNKEAPFNFKFSSHVKVYNSKDYNDVELIQLIEEINPNVIYCSGWIDKAYLKVCKLYRNKIPVIVGFDNQWQGKIKQHIASLISFKKIHPYFNYCWVPGKPQYEYALRLGFKAKQILTGFYSADYHLFHSFYEKHLQSKTQNFPKRFIYIGRYYNFKGIEEMWQAFINLDKRLNIDWELWCLGTGDITPIQHPKIKHIGFVQPENIEEFVSKTGVFVLPSRFEPWGVVVHEFAAAGFPLLCSKAVGANSAFLEDGINGYVFEINNAMSIEKMMEKMILKTPEELIAMGNKSAGKAATITPEKWVESLMSVLSKN